MTLPTKLVNLNIQLIPIDSAAAAYPVIDKAIALIQASHLPHVVGPFGTSIQGNYAALRQLVDDINATLQDAGQEEWVLNLQWHIKAFADVTMSEKTQKFNS